MVDTQLAFDVFVRDRASDVFKKIGKNVNDTGGKLTKFSAGVIGVGIAGAGAFYKLGTTFDDAYDTIQQKTGATGAALDGLKGDFKDVVKDVPTDFATASQAIAGLAQRTGLTGTALSGLTKQVINLSNITGTDVNANVANVTRLFGDWSIKTGDQSKALDELYRASQATGTGVDTLAKTVVQFGAPLRQLGFNFDTSIALLGKWEKEGVNTTTVLSGLKQGLGNFAKAGKDPVKALTDITNKIKDAGTAGKANALAISAFGKRAGPDMAAAIREGRFDLKDLLSTIKNGKGTINSTAKDTEDFTEKWQKLKNQGFIALEPVANKVFGIMGQIADKLTAMAPFIQKHSTLFARLAVVLGILAGAIVVLNFALKAWAVVQAVLDAELWANPIGLIVLAIVALIAIIVLVATKTQFFQTIWHASWGAIKAVGLAVWHAMVTAFHGIVGAISSGATAIGHFASSVASKVGSVLSTIRSVPGKIKGYFGSAGSWLAGAGRAIINGLINGINSAIGGLRNLLGKVTSWIPDWKGPPEKDAKLLVPAGKAIMGGLVGSISGEIPALKSTLGTVTDTIGVHPGVGPNASLATAVGGRGGGGGQLPNSVGLEWIGGNAGDEFMQWLRKNIRVRSGGGSNSVQKALGG